jgi:hypothetical protein
MKKYEGITIAGITDNDSPLERIARIDTHCKGCGSEKMHGAIVCWNCWFSSLKEFSGTLELWLELKK